MRNDPMIFESPSSRAGTYFPDRLPLGHQPPEGCQGSLKRTCFHILDIGQVARGLLAVTPPPAAVLESTAGRKPGGAMPGRHAIAPAIIASTLEFSEERVCRSFRVLNFLGLIDIIGSDAVIADHATLRKLALRTY